MRGLGGAAHAALLKTRRKVSVVDTRVHRFNGIYIEYSRYNSFNSFGIGKIVTWSELE
jgi:hypothetical protein